MNTSLESILLIEDNAGDADLVRELLEERLGPEAKVEVAQTLQDGLERLRGMAPDIVLLDLNLPDSQGLQTYISLHEHSPDTPVVILSGHDDDQLAVSAVRAGAEDYLTKQHADGVVLARSMRHAIERRRSTASLREVEARYRTMVETSEEGLLQVDQDGRIRVVNGRMAELLGRQIWELIGESFKTLFDEEDVEAVRALLAQCVVGGRHTLEARLKRSDGIPLWVLVACHAVHAPCSDELDIIVMLSDITDRVVAHLELDTLKRQLQERVRQRTTQLEEANAELELFNHAVVHDLREPLNAIVGYASLLQVEAGTELTPSGLQRLEQIRRGADNMSDLIGALFALSKLSRTSFRQEPIDLSALANAAVVRLRVADPERLVQVDIDKVPMAIGDSTLVADALANLISNAWKYTARVKSAWVGFSAMRTSDGTTVYLVQDNGVGFDMNDAQRLFRPFSRLQSSQGFEGTGMGLATVKRIIERHGGRIWAESRPGVRTSFFFTLGGPLQSMDG
jgi:PAS domain S-box-containing protein